MVAETPPTSLVAKNAPFDRGAIVIQKVTGEDQVALSGSQPTSLLDSEELAHLGTSQALLSPLRQLPPEILSEIFFLCLYTGDSLDILQPPWLLGHVCSRWRAIALSTPRLWFYLNLDLDTISDTRPKDAVSMVGTYLQRSRETLLSLFIRSSTGSANHHPIVDLLVACSHRWQFVQFSVPIPFFPTLSGIRGRLPSLQRLGILAVKQNESGPTTGTYPVLDIFEGATRLNELKTLCCPQPGEMLALPWSQLVGYQGNYARTEEVISVFAKATNITHCHLSYTLHSPPATFEAPVDHLLRLPSLRTLTLSLSQSRPNILDHLILPVLSEMRISGYGVGFSKLISLLDRSSCSLTKLSLRSRLPFPNGDLIRLLQQTPQLSQLAVQAQTENADLIALTYRPSPEAPKSCIVPNLKRIDIESPTSFSGDLLYAMVESRTRPLNGGFPGTADPGIVVTRLETVHLLLTPALDTNTLTQLRHLRSRGVAVLVNDNLDNDPDALKVRKWRHDLQKWFLQETISLRATVLAIPPAPFDLCTDYAFVVSLGYAQDRLCFHRN